MSAGKVLYVVGNEAAACRLGEALPDAVVCYPGGDVADVEVGEVVYLGGKDVSGFESWWGSRVATRLSAGVELTVAPADCTPWARARGLC